MESGWGIATLIETDNSGTADTPQLCVDRTGNATVVWHQSDGARFNIWSNRYVVGIGWGVATLIETNNMGSAFGPQVAVDGSGRVTAVWHQDDGTRYNIYANRYVVGTGWGTAKLIETDNSGGAYSADVAVDDSGNATAVWHQYDGTRNNVWSNRYVVGTGWSVATLIETDNTGYAESPQVAVDDSGNATAVWHQYDGTRYSIWSNRYVIGTGWTGETLIETDNTGNAFFPKVTVDRSGDVTAVWHQDDGTRYNIWANRYTVDTDWGLAKLVETDNAGSAQYPELAVDYSGDVTAVWHQSDGTRNNVWSNRYSAGTGWNAATLIETDNTGAALYPQLAADKSGSVTAAWTQFDGTRWNALSNRYEVGTGWGAVTFVETDNAGSANRPEVAVDDSGDVTAVWYQSDGYRSNIWSNRYVVPDTTPPPLSLVSPSDGMITETPVVTVSGTTEPGAFLAVNGISVAVESDGSFSCEIALVEGENAITATATDASDNSAAASVSVTYVDPAVELEEELNDALEELSVVQDELNDALEVLIAVLDELSEAQDELSALQGQLDSIQDELDATEEELTSTSDDLESVKSQNLALMAVLGIIAILAIVMSVMFLSLRKKIAGTDVRSSEEEPPPPPA
ncbi:MAG: hypothetical protein JSV90_06670 [Methanobacteriota archaeon]|nr:MAG: hypothetical protein JSV90_06670 [Euryarchaeota archaeon]